MPADLDMTIAAIRSHHRARCFAMKQRKSAELALGAFLRTQLGWSPALSTSEASRIRAEAQAMMAGKQDAGDMADIIAAAHASREPFEVLEKAHEKAMIKLAKTLPVWSGFAEQVRGFGALGLGIIVAEAGNLEHYPKKGHLWKRLGIAVIDGVAQGKLGASAPKADWITHGYNRERRSRIFTIGDAMIKSGDHYRQIYLDRKLYERTRAEMAGLEVLPAARITAKNRDTTISDGHIHRRAQRYMEQRLVRDLWRAWRDDEAKFAMPSAAAERLPSHPAETDDEVPA